MKAGERVYRLLLRALPSPFRTEYGAEMAELFGETARDTVRGGRSRVAFWRRMLADLGTTVAREWWGELRERGRGVTGGPGSRPARHDRYAPPFAAAALAGVAVWCLYVLTLAPTIGFWDAGEYVTVAHLLGIPHPPGNPLFVLLAHAWEVLLSPLGLSTAVRINLFSATLGALTHALWFLVADRALAGMGMDRLARRLGAAAAVTLSATAFTVWNQSNVNEKVYTLSLFTTALVVWLALRWRDGGRRPSYLIAIAGVLALTATNHLMGLLVAPALAVFVLTVDARAALRPQVWARALPVVAVAWSVQLFLPLRAAQRPLVSEGEPTCESAAAATLSVYTWGRAGCPALSAVLTRAQYGKPPISADPTVYPDTDRPRGAGLLAAQLVNYAQYFDWQWGRSVAGREPLFGGARPLVSLLFAGLGLLGAASLARRDRPASALIGLTFVTLSIGLVLYLNFKYGYSIARDRFPDPSHHEVRERDYFFLIGFSLWGVCAGIGLTVLWRRLADALAPRVAATPRLAAAPVFALALLPLALNWSWASRAHDYTARDWAYNVLMSVDPYGVLITNGDNDSFPLWYLQNVEGLRKDVTILLSPYLNTPWYVKQLRELTKPCPPGVSPDDHPTRIVCQRPFRAADLPAPLLAEIGTVRPPEDSIVPLTDRQIDEIAARGFVVSQPLVLRAGRLETTIAAGTTMMPADTFVAAILQATLGQRPVHAMAPARHFTNLGLFDYTVRQGLTWRLNDGPVSDRPGLVALPRGQYSSVTGAYVDVTRTDTLTWKVFVRRGRVIDPEAPWVDQATDDIPLQYAFAHIAVAEGHEQLGQLDEARRHYDTAAWWQRVTDH